MHGVEELIRQNLGAEKAFDIVMLEWRTRFARHAAPMLRERVGDLTDVHIRVLSLLLDLPDHDPVDVPPGANAILVTHDLTPSLTVQLDRDGDRGDRDRRRHAHVARGDPRALARAARRSSGSATATTELHGGERVVLDGGTGMLAINPTDEEIDGVPRAAARGGGGGGGARRARDARGDHARRRARHAPRERRHPGGRRGGARAAAPRAWG